ncbi:hypothetical protein AcW1_003132 [Taiwanofungus camphoratus]|nr:hypothetical protein AcV5_001675 [Antrodia cinnamomea]KAI0942527.1 hypothetical protein AcW1_003132 [Antrodia cinnamomea]
MSLPSVSLESSSPIPSSYATDEPAQLLWYEQSINAAVYIGAMAWGLHMAIFYKSVVSALHDRKKSGRLWLVFICCVFFMATINICCSINFNERAWIDDRNFPGGPLAFFSERQSLPVNVASIATSVITLFLADSLLIYRCHALWKNLYITLFLCAVLVASTIVSVLHCIQATHALNGAWDENTLSLSVPYASLAMTLNVLLVVCLLWRLVDLRRRVPPTLKPETKANYFSVETIIVESALPYGIASFIFLVLYGVRNIGANLFLSLIVQLEGIVSGLIVIRMTNGHAWSLDTIRQAGLRNFTFREDLGRITDASASNSLAMATLNNGVERLADTKVPDVLV